MKNIDKILSIIKKNNGIITNKDIVNLGLTTKYLTTMKRKNLIEKVKNGLYILPNKISDQFFEKTYKHNNTIFSHTTALYFYNLVDRVPIRYEITVPYSYTGNLQKQNDVKLFYIKKELLNLGKTQIKSPQGMMVNAYDIERTICDIIKDEKKIDTELFVTGLQNYVKLKKKNINLLMKYAKAFKIENKVTEKMRLLL